MKKTLVAVVATLAVAIAAGIGWAAIPSGAGVIDACRSSNGSLKVIDADAGQTCGGSQTHLQWNVQGPPGPQGPAGPTGPKGADAEIGAVVIQGDGSAYTGYSVYAVSGVSRLDTGHYEVDFGPSMLTCKRWVSSNVGPRMFSLGHVSSDPSKMRVRAYDGAGAPVDTPVTLYVSC